MSETVAIEAALVARIRQEATASPDQEICGLLFGTSTRIVEVRAVVNVAAEPENAFEIDPQALIDALKSERAGGPRLIGCYHSHPSGDATPSMRDAAAAEPGRLWLIVGGGVARLWRAGTEGFREVTYAIE